MHYSVPPGLKVTAHLHSAIAHEATPGSGQTQKGSKVQIHTHSHSLSWSSNAVLPPIQSLHVRLLHASSMGSSGLLSHTQYHTLKQISRFDEIVDIPSR